MDFLRLHLPGLHQALRGALDSLSTFISYLMGDEVPTAGRREAPAEWGLGEAAAGKQGKIVEEEGQEALEGLGCSQSKGEEELGGPEEPGRCQEGSSAAEQTWGGGEGRSHGSPEDGQDTGVWEEAKASGCRMLSASLEVLQDSEAESEAERDGSSQGQESQVSSEQEMKRGETPSTWEEEEVRPEGPGLPGGVESEWAWHREPEAKGSADSQRVPGESPESEQAGREVVGEESPVLGAGGAGREVEVRCGQSTGIQGTWQPRAEREDWVISGRWETRTASGEEAGETSGGEEGKAALEGEETRTTSGEGSAGTTSEKGEAGTASGEGEAGTTSGEGEAEATSGEEEAGSASGGEEACVISGAEGGWINAGGTELRTPSDREEIWGATGTQEDGTTSGGEETRTTSGGEEDEATSSEEETGTTSYREEAWTVPGTEETCPDSGGEEAGRTSDLEEACTTSGKEETCIASGMVGAWTASGGEEAHTALGREETCTTSDTEEACTALGREEAGTTSAGERTHPTSCEEEVGFLGVRERDYGAAPEQGTPEGTGRVGASEGDLSGDQEEVDEKRDAEASQSDKASQPLGIEGLEGAQALRAGGEGFGRPSKPSEGGEGVQGARDSEITAAGAREKEAVQAKEAETERESSQAAEPTPPPSPEPNLEDTGGQEDGGPRQQSEAGPGPRGEAEGCAEGGEAHSCWTEALLPASRLDVSVSRSRALLSRNASQRRSRPSFRRPPTRETQEEPPSPPLQEGDSVPQQGLLKLEDPPQPSALRPEGTPVPARRRPLGHGFGLAHSGMMQELQARLGQPKPQ
ncbi:apolipoprotein B receptor [Sorex fumeus]|uniref:apolipoprotein B receptor n=1 Tax=Sorex fumeus TaxID=62283 RepID=UPI0024AD216F|nr:apolipoprotein B receptor [Sorex fumeus]